MRLQKAPVSSQLCSPLFIDFNLFAGLDDPCNFLGRLNFFSLTFFGGDDTTHYDQRMRLYANFAKFAIWWFWVFFGHYRGRWEWLGWFNSNMFTMACSGNSGVAEVESAAANHPAAQEGGPEVSRLGPRFQHFKTNPVGCSEGWKKSVCLKVKGFFFVSPPKKKMNGNDGSVSRNPHG